MPITIIATGKTTLIKALQQVEGDYNLNVISSDEIRRDLII